MKVSLTSLHVKEQVVTVVLELAQFQKILACIRTFICEQIDHQIAERGLH